MKSPLFVPRPGRKVRISGWSSHPVTVTVKAVAKDRSFFIVAEGEEAVTIFRRDLNSNCWTQARLSVSVSGVKS